MAQAYRFGLTMLSYFVLFLLHISLHLGHLTDAFFYRKRLTISTFVRKRNNDVGGVKMFIESSVKH